MQVGELAARAGISPDAIRLYEARGLLQADRRGNGYRDFPETALPMVRLIRQAQALGFTLREIGDVVGSLQGELSADQVAAILVDRISEIDRRIAEMTELRRVLSRRLAAVCPIGIGAGGARQRAKPRP
jgi:MerR family transcriptional regulator, copper efflux regulator